MHAKIKSLLLRFQKYGQILSFLYKILRVVFATNRQTLTQTGQELHARKFISRGIKSSL